MEEATDSPANPPTRLHTPWVAIGLLIGASAGGFVMSARHENLFGMIASTTLGLTSLLGLWRGGFRQLIMLPASYVVFYAVVSHAQIVDPWVRSLIGKSNVLIDVGICVIAAIFILLILGRFVTAFRKRLMRNHPVFLAADRMIGTIIGFAEGGLLILILCWVAVLTAPQARVVLDHPNNLSGSVQHQIALTLVALSEDINRSPLEYIANDKNVLEEIPSLRDALYDVGNFEQLELDSLFPEDDREILRTLNTIPAIQQDSLYDELDSND